MKEEEKLITLTAMAEHLGITTRTLTKYVATYAIPHVRIGSLLRFDRDRVIAFLEARQRPVELAPVQPRATAAPRGQKRGRFEGILSRTLPETRI
ncbi:MAG: helix-turn-helix domain-containing protein [Pyrinomonadaceae bacterium]